MALQTPIKRSSQFVLHLIVAVLLLAPAGTVQADPGARLKGPTPTFLAAVAFDVSPALRDLASELAENAEDQL